MAAQRPAIQILGKRELVPHRLSGSFPCPDGGLGVFVIVPNARSVFGKYGIDGRALHRWTPGGATQADALVCANARPDLFKEVSQEVLTKAIQEALDQVEHPEETAGALRGQWRAQLVLGEDGPVIILSRPFASYSQLVVYSDPKKGVWIPSVSRKGKWFTSEKKQANEAPSLAWAIKIGFGILQALVAEACVKRDTGRRAAFDVEWAIDHPIKVPATTKPKVQAPKIKAPKAPKAKGHARPKYREARAKLAEAIAQYGAKVAPRLVLQASDDPKPLTLVVKADDTGWDVRLSAFDTMEHAEKAMRSVGLRQVEGYWTRGRVPKATAEPKPPKPPKSTIAGDIARAFGLEGLPGAKAPRKRTPKAAAPDAGKKDKQMLDLFKRSLKAALE